MPTAARVEGVLREFVYQDEAAGFAVARIAPRSGDAVTVKGNLLGAHVGEALRIEGEWIEHPRFGRQVKIATVEVVPPTDADGLRAYLGSGLVPGVGPATAAAIVERFGLETLDVIERTPARLREVPRLGRKKIDAIAEAIRKQRGLRELVSFLGAQGIGVGATRRIWTHYGADALRLVRENPYRLADDVRGIGFWTADEIAGRLGVARDSPERARAGLVFALNDAASEGHACLPAEELLRRAQRLLQVDEHTLAGALETCEKERSIARDGEALYAPEMLEAERVVAAKLRALGTGKLPPPLADPATIDAAARRARLSLHPHQRSAIAAALRDRALVITGGPGVGKTTIMRLIVDLAVARGRSVLLASPTGRAARRLAESTGKPATTIHRLLDFNPRDGRFGKDQQRPLDAALVIVDEASMIDLQLAAALLRAIAPPTRLVLVGDADQLPSVGPGSVLRDVLESGAVPVARLTQIYRQGATSRIVEGAHAILAGRVPRFSESPAGDGDLFFLERDEPLEALSTVVHVVTERIPKRYQLDPLRDVQVISPMYRGEVGVDRLNGELRERLNPSGASIRSGERLFRVGDRVLVTRNDAARELFNGDVGRVASVNAASRSIDVRFGDRAATFDETRLRDLVPAYAISVHRAQGSEYPAVVLPLVTQHYVMLRRTLLYTAVTRARRVCVLVGSRRALEVAVHDARAEERFSRLRERLRG
ncbi:MAG TPA: ATP-dependent RecD-like DNA helicase [Planctomycetota bacterium]|nr:ATP-dependent RecD-like DNA helicase [Planctomycetota bacterium]